MNWYLFLAVCGFCLFLASCSRVDRSWIGWWFYGRAMARRDSDDQAAAGLFPPSFGLWQMVQPMYGLRGISAITQDTSGRTWELTPRGWAAHARPAFADYRHYLPDTQREQLAAHIDRDVT